MTPQENALFIAKMAQLKPRGGFGLPRTLKDSGYRFGSLYEEDSLLLNLLLKKKA
jgi:hypothetical protein